MLTSFDDMASQLARSVDDFPAFAKAKGWDAAMTAAATINFKALRVMREVDPDEAIAPSTRAAGSDFQETRKEFMPFRFAASNRSSFQPSDDEPLQGRLTITSEQQAAIKNALLAVLMEQFPDRADELNPKAITEVALESDQSGWMQALNAEAVFETHQASFRGDSAGPAEFRQFLTRIEGMPNVPFQSTYAKKEYDETFHALDRNVFGGAKASMQARSLVFLAERIDYLKGDVTPELCGIHALAKRLPLEAERSAVENIIASQLNRFCQPIIDMATDPEAAHAAFDLVGSLLDVWQSYRPALPPPPPPPPVDTTSSSSASEGGVAGRAADAPPAAAASAPARRTQATESSGSADVPRSPFVDIGLALHTLDTLLNRVPERHRPESESRLNQLKEADRR